MTKRSSDQRGSAPAPLCPKCGKPVFRKGQADGVTRYGHRRDVQKLCKWHGTQPAGVEEDRARGIDARQAKALARKAREAGRRRLVITAAQNATPVNKAFFASLLTYCKDRGAQLIVVPYRYKNPTSMWSEKAEHDDWWAPELVPYLMDQRVDLNENLVLLGDIKTQPTASAPLQGFETLTAHKSAIIGHPKLELSTVPTPQAKMAKILTTTGAVTEKNYIPSKAGKKGEHHHTFGAAVVELDGKKFHLRQINATSDGSFCELDREFSPSGVKKTEPPALVMGDSHIEFIDPGVVAATFKGPGSIVKALKIRKRVWHDVYDQYAASHWHRNDPFIAYVKHHEGKGNVERDLDRVFAFVDEVTDAEDANIFVPSNHPDALARWVKETDPRTDPENCVFWAETFKAICLGSSWGETGARSPDPFVYWAQRKLKTAAQAVFPARNESYTIRGIEVAYHGDIGPNGARGSRGGFTRIGVKSVIGHSHSPGIKDGVYQVGTSSRLNLEYAKGPSGWMHTHCLIYANGKRTLINVIDGEWRA